jgi:hypothetical protein
MRTYTTNRRRTQLRVESLEGKTLLSAGSAMHHVAHHVRSAPIIAQATAAFSGTLTGPYSIVHVPVVGYFENLATSGTLSGVGPTRLRATLFARSGSPVHRLAGALVLRNDGGAMRVIVFRSATPGTYTYEVVRARGSDISFKGDSGTLTITLNQTFSAPFFVSGEATTTFS